MTKSRFRTTGTVGKGLAFPPGFICTLALACSVDVVVRMAYGIEPALHYGVASQVIVHGSASLEVRASNDIAAANGLNSVDPGILAIEEQICFAVRTE